MKIIKDTGISVGSSDLSHENISLRQQQQQNTESNHKQRGMKFEHVVVLHALEIANTALGRVSSTQEVIKALTKREIGKIEGAFVKPLSEVVSVILSLLMKRGAVFSPGVIGTRRYYGSVKVLDPELSPLPNFQSRRQRVLRLLKASVQEYGRAVRIGDVVDFAKKHGMIDLAPDMITRSVFSLLETHEINSISTVRGDVKGGNLYLPVELNPDEYLPKEPLTWLGLVEKTALDLLEERRITASTEGGRIRPVSTGEVRNRLASSPEPPSNLNEPILLISALQQLVQTSDARLRKVVLKGRKMVFWAPIDVPDEHLDLGDTYAKDTERVAEALRRAVKRIGHPVNAREVRREIDEDPFLRLAGTSRLACVLTDSSRVTVGWENQARRRRVTRHIFKVGRINGDAYYFHDSKKLPQALAYVRLRQTESAWEMTRSEDNLNSLKTCSLRAVAVGRAMLILADTRRIMEAVEQLFENQTMDAFTRKEAVKLRDLVSRISKDAEQWLSTQDVSDYNLPQEVATEVPGWTAEELLPYLLPVYPRARRVRVPNEIVRLLSKDEDIRRVPNPKFNSRFNQDPLLAAEYLYDRADALIYVASSGRGYECRLQAHFARNELGWLRDSRFILPILNSKNFNERLAAVSCLAFLWSDEGRERLRELATTDPDPGVRQSALWAYGFSRGDYAPELLSSIVQKDTDVCVRDFAFKCLEADGDFWWQV